MMLILFILYLKILVKLLLYLKKKILNINVFSVRSTIKIESLFHKFIIDFLPNYINFFLSSILYFILKIVYMV